MNTKNWNNAKTMQWYIKYDKNIKYHFNKKKVNGHINYNWKYKLNSCVFILFLADK